MKKSNRNVHKNDIIQKKRDELKYKELYIMLAVRKGGKTTMRILDSLFIRPRNANQLSKLLNVNYNTIIFHVKLILEHEYIERKKMGNSYILYPSDKLIKIYDEYLIIKEILENE